MYTITDKDLIRKAMCAPKSMPDAYLPKELEAIGTSKFKGDSLPKAWSVNNDFTIGKTYPVYYNEDGIDSSFFVIGKDGAGKKMTPTAWSKVKEI